MSLASFPPARRREVLLVALAFTVLALLRLATLARDTWEWDEVLFMEGVRDGLDVRLNHPHPPGYPVFIRIGQALRAAGVEPFRATTLAGALGGYLAALGLYLLLRELGAARAWALVGALLFALTPSVWLHAVRPLSDGPGAAAALFAALFLVRAIRTRGGASLVGAALCVALAAGVRPQVGLALLPAAAVAAAATLLRGRSVRPLVLAAVAGVLLSAAIWIPVFESSGGIRTWKERLNAQMAYVTTFDSPKAADLRRAEFWSRWFLDPVGSHVVAAAFLTLAVLGVVLAPRSAGLVLLVFVPVAALALAVLSKDSAPRYVLGFWAAPAALAALALERLARAPAGRVAAPAVALVLLGGFAAIGAPPIVEVATHDSPSVAAMRAVATSGVAPEAVVVTGSFRAHVDEFFRYRARVVDGLVPVALPPGSVLVGAEGRPFGLLPDRVFAFTHPLLPRLTRGRYLRTEIFEGRSGAGVFVPSVKAPGWQFRGHVELWTGGAFTVRAATPADVAFTATAPEENAALEIGSGDGPLRTTELASGAHDVVTFHASPDSVERLFTVTARGGHLLLDDFHIAARVARDPK